MEPNRNKDLSDHARKVLAHLDQVLFLRRQIISLMEDLGIKSLQSVCVPSPSDYSKTKVQRTRPREAGFESAVEEKDRLEKQLRDLSAQLLPLEGQAKKIIRQYTTLIHRRVMLLYFIDGYKWSFVAKSVSRTERHIYRLRNEALEMISLPEDAIWLDE